MAKWIDLKSLLTAALIAVAGWGWKLHNDVAELSRWREAEDAYDVEDNTKPNVNKLLRWTNECRIKLDLEPRYFDD